MTMKHRCGHAAFRAALIAAALGVAACPPAAHAEDAKTYIAQAKALLAKGDVKGAVIELRNAVREKPDDPNIHVELAGLYLKLDNLPAAEAEARIAQQQHGDPDTVDPVLAETLRRGGQVSQLFDLIQPANARRTRRNWRVRLTFGLAHMTLW